MFSHRIGITQAVKLAQKESIDSDLLNSLWSAVTLIYWDSVSYERYSPGMTKKSDRADLITKLWMDFYKQPTDQIPSTFSNVIASIRKWYFSSPWHATYDFIEFCAEYGPPSLKNRFIEICNKFLERESSAYRFINGQITEITSDAEIESVESALSSRALAAGAKHHLDTALKLLNNRTNPDYRNSIKESISAIESLAKNLTNDDKATLGKALKTLENQKTIHPSLKSAFTALYGYTSDAEGIRHALLEESTLTKADAKFMLVACSAFINYLTEIGNE